MDALSSSYSMRNLMGRHYLEHLLVFLSADYFLDIWNNPGPTEPPDEEPPPAEDPPADLSPRERIAWIKAPFSASTWFQRMARVRDGVSRLNATLNYSEALNTGEKLKLTIAQLPFDDKDRWVACP